MWAGGPLDLLFFCRRQSNHTARLTKQTTFNKTRYTTNISTNSHTITEQNINSNLITIHTTIVTKYHRKRKNNKILPNSEQINQAFSNHTYTNLTRTHTQHLLNCTHTTLSPLDLCPDPVGVAGCWPPRQPHVWAPIERGSWTPPPMMHGGSW